MRPPVAVIFAMDVSTENAIAYVSAAIVMCVFLLCATFLIARDKWPFDWPRRKDDQ